MTLAVSPDEETSHFGGERLAETLSPDGVIVGESTGLDVCVAARGSFGGRNGINAVRPVVKTLARFNKEYDSDIHERLGMPVSPPTWI